MLQAAQNLRAVVHHLKKVTRPQAEVPPFAQVRLALIRQESLRATFVVGLRRSHDHRLVVHHGLAVLLAHRLVEDHRALRLAQAVGAALALALRLAVATVVVAHVEAGEAVKAI